MMMMMQATDERLQLITEKRKLQTEVENKRRQLEDDRRTLQHLKSQAVREQWLLDGASSAGPDQDQTKTRNLEATISRLEQELVSLETGAVAPGPIKEAEVKGQDAPPPCYIFQEVKVHTSSQINRPIECAEQLKRAVYSVEITVERDKSTGETRVLSTNTKLPVDLSDQGIKVYEDEQKVVHEMNGEDGGHQLSCFEVEELIHKADEASMMSQTVDAVSSLPGTEMQEEEEVVPVREPPSLIHKPSFPVEIPGVEARPGPEPSVAEASAENPVTMVFMGYQSVEDEAETKRVLGLQGTVKAELVIIDNGHDKTSPGERDADKTSSRAGTQGLPPQVSPQLTATNPPESMMAKTKEPIREMPRKASGNTPKDPAGDPVEKRSEDPHGDCGGDPPEEAAREVVKIKKGKPCKCCTIM